MPATLIMLLCTMLFAFSDAAGKEANSQIDLVDFALIRTATVVVTLFAVLHLYNIAAEARRPTLTRFHWIRGFLWFVTAFLFAASFLHRRDLATVYIITFLHPVWTLVFSRVLGAPIRVSSVAGTCIVIMFLGASLSSMPPDYKLDTLPRALASAGNLLPLTAGMVFAFTIVYTKKITEILSEGSVVLTYKSSLTALVFATALWLPFAYTGTSIFSAPTALAADTGLLRLLLIAIVAGAIAGAANWALVEATARSRNVLIVSALDYTILIWAWIIDAAWGAVWPALHQWIGATLIVAAGFIFLLDESRNTQPDSS